MAETFWEADLCDLRGPSSLQPWCLLWNSLFPEDFLNNTWNHFKSSLFSFPFCSGHFPPLTIHTLSCSFPRALTMRKQKHLLLFLFTCLEFIFLWNIIQQTITARANLYDWVLWATSKTSTQNILSQEQGCRLLRHQRHSTVPSSFLS